jgi:hypothetical protein
LAQLSQDTSILGFFWKRGKTPQKLFLKATVRPHIRLWQKVKKKLVVGFIIVTPTPPFTDLCII